MAARYPDINETNRVLAVIDVTLSDRLTTNDICLICDKKQSRVIRHAITKHGLDTQSATIMPWMNKEIDFSSWYLKWLKSGNVTNPSKKVLTNKTIIETAFKNVMNAINYNGDDENMEPNVDDTDMINENMETHHTWTNHLPMAMDIENFVRWLQDPLASGIDSPDRLQKIIVFWKRLFLSKNTDNIADMAKLDLPREFIEKNDIAWSSKCTYFSFLKYLIKYIDNLDLNIQIWRNSLQNACKISKHKIPIPRHTEDDVTYLKNLAERIGTLHIV